MSGPISVEMLRQILDYDPETGALTWRERPVSMFTDNGTGGADGNAARWNGKNAGKPALSTITNGYKHGPIFNQCQYAHRVAWAIYHGAWPEDRLDHINHDRTDNRISNLRVVSAEENSRNQRPTAKAVARGALGISWDRENQKWRAFIRANGRRVCLGRYAKKNDAVAARRKAEALYGYHPNHGRVAK